MPFYTPSKEPEFNIDYDIYKPIYVHFYTDINGNIRPLKLKYEDKNGIRVSLNIDGIKYKKDIQGGFMYCCLVANYNRLQEINLVYFSKEHSWFLVVL